MWSSAWWLAVNALAVYRASILLSKDKIADPFRQWVRCHGYKLEPMKHLEDRFIRRPAPGRRGALGRFAYELVICPWCLSIWFAAVAVILTATVPSIWRWPALLLALSGFVVVATRREE